MVDRCARLHKSSQRLLHGIDCVFSHSSMRSPFAAHDADQARWCIGFDFVVASQFFSGARAAGTDERAGAGKTADDLIWTYGGGEIFVDVVQQIRDIVL